MGYLILVRHGESQWNLSNRFTGWTDVPLSERGVREAQTTASKLAGLKIDMAFTSKQIRAHQTLMSILLKQKRTGIFLHEDDKKHSKWFLHPHKFEKNEIPIYSDSALNERYYGKLQGINKDAARKKYGKEQVFIWRRSFDIPPPGGESLKDTCKRTLPYFKKKIMPMVKKGQNIIVSAHGNSLRAIIKYLEGISEKEIPHLELATGKPIIYKYSRGKLVKVKHKHTFNRPYRNK